MAKAVAIFSGLLFFITLSACTAGGSNTAAYSPMPANATGTQSQNQLKSSISASSMSVPSPATKSSAIPSGSPSALANGEAGPKITPDRNSGHMTIEYPNSGFNNSDDSPGKKRKISLTPGNYSDPENAVATFLFDLYMKQSLCFDNIHASIKTDSENLSFVRTLELLEQMILNLGQVDVLTLPRIGYYEDGTPYVNFSQGTAGYKTHENDIIRFGSIVKKEGYSQVTKGNFKSSDPSLYYEVDTERNGSSPSIIYFEAVKAKNGDFTYRCISIFQGRVEGVYVSVANDLMQAGFSVGKLPENFKLAPLEKSTSMKKSDEENGLKQSYDLFASDDGAVIRPVEADVK